MLALLAGGCVLAKNLFFLTEPEGAPPPVKEGKRVSVLLLGIDARQGETMARSDTMILADVDPKSKRMTLLSIPRDTGVSIPGYGWDKINSATVYGGPELAMKVVSELTGVSVKHYVLTNFSGFKEIVDILGGVTIDVEQDMYHWDDEDGGAYEIDLERGLQRLDGDKSLQYVRFRDYPMGDIDRTAIQQKFLAALAKEVLQPATIPKLPKLVPEINRYVKTNLSVSNMVTLASAAKNLENCNIAAQTLPGRPVDIEGGSYWGVNPSEARQAVAMIFNGETLNNIVLSTPLTGQYAGAVGTRATGQSNAGEKADEDDQSTGDKDGKSTGLPKPGQDGQGGKTGKDGIMKVVPIGTDPKAGSGDPGTSGKGSSTGPSKGATTTPEPGPEAEPGTEPGSGTKPGEPPPASPPGGSNIEPERETVPPAIPGVPGAKKNT